MPLETEGHSLSPVWTPDGRSVAYFSRQDMYWRPADGSAEAQLLLARDFPQYPKSWTKDGRVLIFAEDHPTTRGDVWMLSLGGEPRPLLTTAAHEMVPRLSPDDRWLAYSSDESGRHEVYVRPFPNVNRGKWLVSTSGGMAPVWSPNGRELFYLNGTAMMGVAVNTRGSQFDIGAPELLFTGPFETGSPQFDVSADGSFVMVEADPDAKPTQIHLVTNWLAELKRLVP
jgi:serine/threonine-protein kinase